MRSITGAFWWLLYLLPLKRWAVGVQRWLLERNEPRRSLTHFETPEDLAQFIRLNFEYRKDNEGRTFKWWDWTSHPEVFQWRIDREGRADGDCDDVALWAGWVLRRMPTVRDVLLLSVGYSKPMSAHTVVVFLRGGHWYLLNGKAGLKLLADGVDSAVQEVVRQQRPKSPEQVARWYIFETLDYKRVAIGPRGKVRR